MHSSILRAFLIITFVVGAMATVFGSSNAHSLLSVAPHNSEDTTKIYLPLVARQQPRTPLRTKTAFGVQTYISTGNGTKYYSYLQESGVSWVRVPVSWSSVEPTNTSPDKYNWASADALVKPVVDGGYNLILTHEGNPTWAATDKSGPINKTTLDEFKQYITALAERYDGDGVDDAPNSPMVTHFEMYNEPDWGTLPNVEAWGDHGADYAAMLAVASPAIKGANPQAKVAMGGISYDNFIEDGGGFVKSFLDDVLTAGGGANFDVMNFHFYPNFSSNWTSEQKFAVLEKSQSIRDTLAKHGLSKPMIITEAGWHDNSTPGLPSTQRTQSYYLTVMFIESIAADLDFMIYWTLYDVGGDYAYNNGLVTNADPPAKKQSFEAIKVLTREFGDAEYVRALPESETGDKLLEVYEFKDSTPNRTLYAAWLNPVDSSLSEHQITLPAAQATMYDNRWNLTSTINDADDGATDGKVKITIKNDPIYIEVK